jgi:hypothetical protein
MRGRARGEPQPGGRLQLAAEPGDDGGVAAVHGGGERAIHVDVIHHVAQVVEGHLEEAVGVGEVELGRFAAVVEDHHPPRDDLDAADAKGGQGAVGDPRDETVGLDAAGGLAGQLALLGRDVVDGDGGQAELVPRPLELAAQPGAVGFGDFLVAAGAGVPAPVEGLGGHGIHLAPQLGQELEAPVEDQADARKACPQVTQGAHDAGLLGGHVGAAGEAVGVEGVEEEAAVALLPQRGDDGVGDELGPAGGGLVDDFRGPGCVGCDAPAGGHPGGPAPGGVDLADADVGEEFAAGGVGLAVGAAVAARVEAVVGVDHRDVEGVEFGKGASLAYTKATDGSAARAGTAGSVQARANSKRVVSRRRRSGTGTGTRASRT